jgi:hypothetical protein
VSFKVKVEAFCSAVEGDVSVSKRLAWNLEYGVKPGVAEMLEIPSDPFHLPPVVGAFLAHLNDAVLPVPGLWKLGEGRLNA